jgi:SAM-dependent methyltransferase
VVDELDPRPGERVLDLGCGTGALTARMASAGADVLGLDLDPDMIRRVRELHPELRFEAGDAHTFTAPAGWEGLDAVFSNAALHWMPRPAELIGRVRQALRPGGRFVAEMGGPGNVAEVERALYHARAGAGLPVRPSPWLFPSIAAYARLLEEGGLEPRRMVLFDRPTPLAEGPARWSTGWGCSAAPSFRTSRPTGATTCWSGPPRSCGRPCCATAAGTWTTAACASRR